MRGVPQVTVTKAGLWRCRGMADVWTPTPPPQALPERARFALSAAAPAFMVMAANAVLMLAGGGADLPKFENAALSPPVWASATIWIGMLVLLGAARHEVARRPDPETFAMDALLVAAMVYPFTANAFGADWTAANTMTLLAIGAMAVVAVWPQSRRAAALVVPAMGWLGWSSWLSVAEAAVA